MIQLFVGTDFPLTLNLSDYSDTPITNDTLVLTIATKEGSPLLLQDGNPVGELTPTNEGEGVYTVAITKEMAIAANQPYIGTLTTTDISSNVTPFDIEMIGVRQVV